MSRFAYIALHVVLYSAVMAAVAWAVWQVMPGIADWIMANVGVYPAFFGMIGLIVFGWWLSYCLGQDQEIHYVEPAAPGWLQSFGKIYLGALGVFLFVVMVAVILAEGR